MQVGLTQRGHTVRISEGFLRVSQKNALGLKHVLLQHSHVQKACQHHLGDTHMCLSHKDTCPKNGVALPSQTGFFFFSTDPCDSYNQTRIFTKIPLLTACQQQRSPLASLFASQFLKKASLLLPAPDNTSVSPLTGGVCRSQSAPDKTEKRG